MKSSSLCTTLALSLIFSGLLAAGEPGIQQFNEQLASRIETLRATLKREGKTFQVGVNPAMEFSIDQLCGTRVELRQADWRAHAEGGYLNNQGPHLAAEALPPAFLGWFSPVKNQGQCGSCWAFSTIGNLESAVLKSHGAPQGRIAGDGSVVPSGVVTSLSEQQVLSCNPNGYGCGGGFFSWDMFIPANAANGSGYYQGAIPAAVFPYVAQRVACSFNANTSYTPVSQWGYVGDGNSVADTTAIKEAIYQHGAVSACVYADSTFQAYTGGVFTGTDNYSQINHAIVLVGWDDAKGAWLLKNSWSAQWGNNGFMWISYGVNSVGYSAAWVDNQ